MDLTEYRASDNEKIRTEDLMRLINGISSPGGNALDIGARDGYFSKLLTRHFFKVTALDLEKPMIDHDGVTCIEGDISGLDIQDNSFDFVFCAEVLEHIPPHLLEKACSELSRVSSKFVLIGVPYKQDTRFGRTTCYSCGKKNPPWGHINEFDEARLVNLFRTMSVKELSFVGSTNSQTNSLSTVLMDLAGNPYGTYQQEEPCLYCGDKLKKPPERNVYQKVFTRVATLLRKPQSALMKEHPNWIHILFEK